MGINFPNTPAVGDKYPTPSVAGIPTYTWDGEKWTTSGASIGQYVAKAGDTMTGLLAINSDFAGSNNPGQLIVINPAAKGAFLDMYRNSPSPANGNTIGATRYYGNNSALAKTFLGSVSGLCTDITAGAEKHQIVLQTQDTGITKSLTFDGSNLSLFNGVSSISITPREKLTAARTYFVSTSGSDSNDGLSAGSSFLTIQKAIEVCKNTLDFNNFGVTIQVGNGTYTGGGVLDTAIIGRPSGITIIGDPVTPSNVVISVGVAHCFVSNTTGSWLNISGMKLMTTGGFCVLADNGSLIRFTGNMEFGTGFYHIVAQNGGHVILQANYSITGAAQQHFNTVNQGRIRTSAAITVTGVGALAFSSFAACGNLGLFDTTVAGSITFAGTGSFTGQRYNVSTNGVINTNAGGANYFPGSTAGVTATGGQYV